MASLDVLRGIAIAGMVLVHVAKASHGSGSTFDWWRAGFDFLIAGKFYTIFALLFGISFGLQLSRIRPGDSVAAGVLSRLAGLAIIMGALKFFFGSSLLYYAIWGAPLVLMYRLPSRWLGAIAIALVYLHSQIGSAMHLPQNSVVALLTWADPGYRGPFVLAMFIAGLLAVRHGLVSDPKAHRASLLGIAALGSVLAVLGVRTQLLGIAYAVLVVLYVNKGPRMLALIGRASLSNYALHLLIVRFLFSQWGLGLSLDWWWTIPVSALVLSAMVTLSAAWLRSYPQGPLEWLWRAMSAVARSSFLAPRLTTEASVTAASSPRRP